MRKQRNWNESYRDGDVPWDTGRPSPELQRVIMQHGIQPCRALEVGCGSGTNSVWLAQQGFQVTAIDLAPLAVEQANRKAKKSGVQIRFLSGDICKWDQPMESFGFFFDRGCYHAVRREPGNAYVNVISRLLASGGRGLILAGNAREPHVPGPPVVSEEDIRNELGEKFCILDLQEFRFDEAPGVPEKFLGWSCLVKKLDL
ncbi:MAG: class I SAM-dependent methyltransferase [Planctomycetales bacterium]|nr:class I SAM-dependent methyltransferase [Planctomycetales bacterium]